MPMKKKVQRLRRDSVSNYIDNIAFLRTSFSENDVKNYDVRYIPPKNKKKSTFILYEAEETNVTQIK